MCISFTLVYKICSLFLNSRVCFCLTEQTQRESEIVNVKANSTIIRTVTRFEVNSRLLFPKQRLPYNLLSLQTRQMFCTLLLLG